MSDLAGEMPFSIGELLFIACYVGSLLVIGWLGLRARREQSLQDFYLAGRDVGFVVLLLTLYATQYSGNTLFGFTGKTYRVGYSWTVCIHFMTAIVVCYLLFAPKLFKLSREHSFLTPADYLVTRFQSRALGVFGSLLMIFGLANYLLAQLMALGNAFRGFSTESPYRAYVAGVVVLALIIVVYESLGGFRAVAWTDMIQGSVLMVGFLVLIWMLFDQFGTLAEATAALPLAKKEPPDAAGSLEWSSWILMVGLGGALYPQAIQRIYAARSGRALRRSLIVMAFLPLTTTLVAVVFGVMAAANLPQLEQGDAVLTVVCREIQQSSLFGRWLVVVLFAGILAAVMSTADSALLSISSMFTNDVYLQFISPTADQKRLTAIGKRTSWTLIVLMSAAACLLYDVQLVTLLRIKFELLVQLAPAFLLGVHWRGLRGGPVLAGMIVGVTVAVGMTVWADFWGLFEIPATHLNQVYGVHAGVYAVALNTVIAVVGSLVLNSPADDTESQFVTSASKTRT